MELGAKELAVQLINQREMGCGIAWRAVWTVCRAIVWIRQHLAPEGGPVTGCCQVFLDRCIHEWRKTDLLWRNPSFGHICSSEQNAPQRPQMSSQCYRREACHSHVYLCVHVPRVDYHAMQYSTCTSDTCN